MRERKPLGLTIEREQRGERLVSRWLSLEIRSLADLMTSVQYLDRKIKGQRPKGATDELRRPHALLLNELGNWRTRKTRQRNRLTLAKQGPVTRRVAKGAGDLLMGRARTSARCAGRDISKKGGSAGVYAAWGRWTGCECAQGIGAAAYMYEAGGTAAGYRRSDQGAGREHMLPVFYKWSAD